MKRDSYIDFLRGFAMLLVIMGHSMTCSTVGSEESIVFNAIWSLQMPLFFIVSGYVSRYRRNHDVRSSFKTIIKRTVSYLLPWIVWDFFIRGFVLGDKKMLDFRFVFWHLDNGYWFLFVIWVISLLIEICNILSLLLCDYSKKYRYTLINSFFVLLFMVGLSLIGSKVGYKFMGIHLTLYYTPFYFAGIVFGRFQNELESTALWNKSKNCLYFIMLITWVFLICRVNFYFAPDNGTFIVFRACASLAGCVSVVAFCRTSYTTVFAVTEESEQKSNMHQLSQRLVEITEWIGTRTLEIYLIHSFVLDLVTSDPQYSYYSFVGKISIVVTFLATVFASSLFCTLLKGNCFTNTLLFGKGNCFVKYPRRNVKKNK